MRTKHFFMAMALPLAFAACTSEEFESAQNATDLSGRKVLGDVVLTFGDEAGTRMTAAGGAIGFVAGDGVGACLVDNYIGEQDGERGAIDNYNLTSTIQTNYQYKYEGGAWMTTARMVEGNYIFYAPYNGDHLSRTPLKTGVPTTQELTLGADGKVDAYSILDAFVKSGTPAYVGYKFLKAEGQDLKVSVNMKPIFAYPLVTFSNDDTSASATDVVITKFVVTGTIPAEMELNIGSAGDVAKAGNGVVGKLFDQGADASKNGAWAKSANMIGNKTADVTNAASKTNGAITINVPNGALKVAKGETVKFHIVLPATNAANYKVYAYDGNGKAYGLTVTGAALSAGKIYPDGQYKADGTTYATAANAFMTKTSAITPAAAPNMVNTTEELVALVAGATGNVAGIEATSDDVKITPEVIAAINPNLTYTFTSVMGISGDLEIANFDFTNGAVVESGVVTWKKAISTATSNLTVKSGATLKVKADISGATVTVLKDGEAEIGAGTTNNASDDITVANLVNKGETTIKCDAAVTTITNYSTTTGDEYCGTINDERTGIPTAINGNWICSNEVVVTAATTVNAGATLTISNSLDLTGASAGLTVSGKAKLVVDEDAMLINNATSAVTINADGLMEAKGLFKGDAIDVANGRINLYQGYQAVNAFSTSGGILADVRETYTTDVTTPEVLVTNANLLSVKNLTLKADAALPKANVELQDGGTMTLNGNVTAGAVSTITTVGDATISGVYNLASAAATNTLTIVVAKKKTLTLKGISLVDGGAGVTLKGETGATGTDNAKYKLTSGASIGAGVTVDDATTSGAAATIKKVN